MTGLCVVCDRRGVELGTYVCSRCLERVADDLRAIGRLYGQLDPTPGSAGQRGGRGAPGFGSRSPARDDVLVLMDRRTRRLESGPVAVVNVLRYWGVSAGCDLVPFARRYDFGEMAAELHQLRRSLERVCGELEPMIPLGGCPTVTDWIDTEAVTCGGRLRARVWGETARCSRDPQHRWEGLEELRSLAAALGDSWMDYAGLERYLGVKVSTLRVWALREGWRRDPDSPPGRPLYSLQDARATWMRRRRVA